MTGSSPLERRPGSTPPAPDVCEECGNTDFIPRSQQPRDDSETDKEYVFAYHECSDPDCDATYNDRSAQLLRPDNVRAPDWEEIFGHPEPYDHQAVAIEDIIQTSLSNGFTVMEGGCGTGKTMIALTAGIHLVRDPTTKFERVMVLTSVKQQLRQFESDLQIINSNLPEDVPAAKAVTLVGKTDLCPYAREEEAGINEGNVARECRRLRDQTSKIMSDGHDGVELARSAISRTETEQWTCAGAQSPYANALPRARDLEYCPFYSNYKEHDDPLFTFGHAPDCILHPDQIVKQAVQKGVCPHSAMASLCRDAEVVVANYYHAFDKNTLQITQHIIDETTLLVCDEAHMLEPRVRGILSTSVPLYGFGQAASEVGAVYNAVANDRINDDRIRTRTPPTSVATEKLGESGVSPGVLKETYWLLRRIQNTFDGFIKQFLNNNHAGWQNDLGSLGPRIEIPLRDPETPEPDSFTKWAQKQDMSEEAWSYLTTIADAVEDVLTAGSEDGDTNYSISEVTQLLDEWFRCGHTRYFREITLSKVDDPYPSNGWQGYFNANVEIHSVMPQSVIGRRLDQFGAGILMSATLEPIDVYREVTGLNFKSQMDNLLVTERVYNAEFPKEKRLSLTLDLPKFTYENRGDITDDTETRRQYSQAIRLLARTTPGNVLVCMPSYREARWAAELLKQNPHVSKEVLLDQSSGEEETQRLKEYFINGEPKVLVTSLRGTLTEGVDFDGDKLLACIVCGVPIENVGSPKTQAVEAAYKDQFGGIGFDYGLTVPAVRKTRQALGRVIRGTDDIGVRVLADRRYAGKGRNSVRHYLSDDEQAEYDVVEDIEQYKNELVQFWKRFA